MKKRIWWNDIKGNGLLSVTTWIFMSVSAFLFALTCFLTAGLLGSVNELMEKAQTPDYMQMHAGEIAKEELERFGEENESVSKYQTLNFLNLENATIFLNGYSLKDSTQDNGVCVQSEKFDYLLDMHNQVVEVHEGEIYVPVCYKQQYRLEEGQKVQIGTENFCIAGFIRDSQMNSMMASSKRFLVNEADYERLRTTGNEEYLIEFLLKEGASVGAFETEYSDKKLPCNGPAVTKPLIRMMNALSDGLMIMVILLMSIVLVLISILCIRFTLLTQLENDRKEIGTLKAIGISKRNIRQIYFLKFLALSGLGAVTGLVLSVPVKKMVSVHMQELYGAPQNGMIQFAVAFVGVALTEGVLLLSVRKTLKRTERLSPVEAFRDGQENGNEKHQKGFSLQYAIVALVIGLGIFMMVLPQNLLSTISSPQFVTYMGIGDGDLRIDIRQTQNIAEKTEQLKQIISEDERVSRFAALKTVSCAVKMPDGSLTNLNVEQGNHQVFSLTYAEGRAPEKMGEIALSYLCAKEWEVTVGDTILLSVGEIEKEYTVCGIYSDITNGGKTAKATVLPAEGSLMWSVFYVSLKNETESEQWLTEYTDLLSKKGISAKAVDIQKYVEDTYGQTIREIGMAARVAALISVLVMFVVVVLFTRLIVAKDRSNISLVKAIGFSGDEITKRYLFQYLCIIVAGILVGFLASNLFGAYVVGILLKTLGAMGFRLLIAHPIVYGMIVAITVITVYCAALIGLAKVKDVKAYECCMGKE